MSDILRNELINHFQHFPLTFPDFSETREHVQRAAK